MARRKVGESWRDALGARMRDLGLEEACLAAFDGRIAAGESEAEAAYRILAEHGRLWSVEEPGLPAQAGPTPPAA